MNKRFVLPTLLLLCVFLFALAACATTQETVADDMSLVMVSESTKAPGEYTVVEFLGTPTPEPTLVPPTPEPTLTPTPTATPLPARYYLEANVQEGVIVAGGVYRWVVDFYSQEAAENFSCSLYADKDAVSSEPPLYEFSEGTEVFLLCDYVPVEGWQSYLEYVSPSSEVSQQA